MWLYGWKLLAEHHHPVTFCGHMHCGSGNVFNLFAWSHKTPWLICHVILWVGTPQGKSPPCQDWWPQALWWWRCFKWLKSKISYAYFNLSLLFISIFISKAYNISGSRTETSEHRYSFLPVYPWSTSCTSPKSLQEQLMEQTQGIMR